MTLKLKETNISNEHNNWREADQLAIYKYEKLN